MSGGFPGRGVTALRINSDVVTWPEQQGSLRRVKVPAAGGRYVGLVMLFSNATGEPLAIMPDGVMQRLRVGATSALAARYLARAGVATMGLAGLRRSGAWPGPCLCRPAGVEAHPRSSAPARQNRKALVASVQTVGWLRGGGGEHAGGGGGRAPDIVSCATNSLDAVFHAGVGEARACT